MPIEFIPKCRRLCIVAGQRDVSPKTIALEAEGHVLEGAARLSSNVLQARCMTPLGAA